MSIKNPTPHTHRCGVFYVRLVVPLALRKDIHVGKEDGEMTVGTVHSLQGA